MTTQPRPDHSPDDEVGRPGNPVFDTQYVTYVFNQRGYHVNEFAARLDMSNDVVEGFLRGDVEVGDLRMATLLAMVNLLGIPLHTIFTRPPTPADPADPANLGGRAPEGDTHSDLPGLIGVTELADAEQLVATLYDTGRATPTLIGDIANAYGWTTDRVHAAADEATRRLAPAGLRVHTSHGELFVAPISDHLQAQQALAARRTYERGLTYTHYKAAYQVLTGQQVTVNNSGRQRLRTLGGLVNTGVLAQAKNPALTSAAREAFLPPEPATSGDTP